MGRELVVNGKENEDQVKTQRALFGKHYCPAFVVLAFARDSRQLDLGREEDLT